jgi:hypothetical protein
MYCFLQRLPRRRPESLKSATPAGRPDEERLHHVTDPEDVQGLNGPSTRQIYVLVGWDCVLDYLKHRVIMD